MKSAPLIVFLILLVPVVVFGQTDCSKEGDSAFYVNFMEDTRDMIAGENFCWTVGPANFAFVSSVCVDADTFCFHAWDTKGWAIVADPPLEECNELESGYLWW